MPRVAIKKKEYMVSDLSKWMVGKMYETGVNQSDLAQLIGISQPAFSARLKRGSFSYSDMLTILKRLNASDKEIIKLMRL